MHHDRQSEDRARSETTRTSLIMLAFGLTILLFLVAIDRPHWFRLKPATGTAAAMSQAVTSIAPKTAGASRT